MPENKDKVVEENFPKEDADAEPQTQQVKTSFVQNPEGTQKKERERLTVGDILTYIARETHMVRELLEKMSAEKTPPVAPVIGDAPQQIQQTQQQSTFSAPAPAPDAGLEKVRKALAEFINDGSIEIEVTDKSTMFYIVRTKKFLGSDNFSKIASIVRQELGGEYVSQGKASHFKVPKGTV